ncbi:hypothetical protein LPB86_01945 [Pedobacter sp. MC2016-14]|uniref:hypothetical protein n=1 Tax=Pedobacter sp. MC2016-14 TaxID=2897327 RepID=UPI001E2A7392|nr:hypothetical protein [Pedobacter sp. MC2016-14]MCD0486972.1 hypothetical protein [Pedobacter sp. MC2016-14]
MKRSCKVNRLYVLCTVLMCCMFCSAKLYAQQQAHYFIEAEDFQFPGAWVLEKEAGTNVLGKGALMGNHSTAETSDAFTVLNIKAKGNFFAWTRSRDYATNKPGSRKYLLICNDQPLQKESGTHLSEGYAWEKVGAVNFEAGENLLRLKNTSRNYARCDALFFTTDASLNPNSHLTLNNYAIKPLQVKENHTKVNVAAASVFTKRDKLLAVLSNDKIRLSFEEVTDKQRAKKHIVSITASFQENRWVNIKPGTEEHRIFLLRAKNPGLKFGPFYALWSNSSSLSDFSVKGKMYKTLDQTSAKNPFLSGELLLCRPVSVQRLSPEALNVNYRAEDGTIVEGIWRLNPQASHYELSLSHQAQTEGYYSFVVSAFQSIPENEVKSVQLPPMFNYQRIPQSPVFIPGAMTPQPLSIVTANHHGRPLSLFVAGALHDFPLDWGKDLSSRIGFSLKNELNEVQPVAFAPVLGLEDSKLASGQTLKRNFTIGAVAGDWNSALGYISENIYRVKDYRSQKEGSLTNAAFNIIDLIKNEDASGWSPELKGFYDIEADPKIAPTVAQSAPLAIISAAVIGKDEDLYVSRALPSIEYTLSRSAFRWAKSAGTPYNQGIASLQLNPYTNIQFNTAYFEALNQLLDKKNPWLVEVAMPGKLPRKSAGYSVNVPSWTQELAAYRLTLDKKWLDLAILHATTFVQNEVYGQKTVALTAQPFYNTSFYPYWWDLMDLYEVSKNKIFLEAATYASYFTIAGIRAYPLVENKQQLIHPGNEFEGNTNLWWKNGEKFRLGFPRKAGDVLEKEVPQSLVSPVGLGLEQPVTFFLPNKNVRHIFMSSWAPHLLRLSAPNPSNIFEIYARNSIIGRFTNYPGYYATGFTDLTYHADYPLKGPDVNSIYYHHISPHLAFTFDFLVTEAVQRAAGNISFPWGKQEGFVWFNNRIYGAGEGTVFGDAQVKLWLKKDLVTLNNPQINYLSGISNDHFWLVLLNESDQEQGFDVVLSPETGVKNNGIKLYKGKSAEPESLTLIQNKMNGVIAGKGLTAYSFPLASPIVKKELPPVKNGLLEIDAGAPWGTVYAFRIRSPFGWDSIYAYLGTASAAGVEAELMVNGDKNASKKLVAYPFEWSFIKVDPLQPVSMSLKLKNKITNESRQIKLEFEGF